MKKIRSYTRIAIVTGIISLVVTTLSVVVIYYGVCWGFPMCNSWIWDEIPMLSQSLFIINWAFLIFIHWFFGWIWLKLENYFDKRSAHRVASLVSVVLLVTFLIVQIFYLVMNLNSISA